MPALGISMKVAHIDNAIQLDYLTSEVPLEEDEITRTGPNIPTDNNATYDSLHCGMAGGSGDYEDEGDESNERHALPTASRGGHPVTELETVELGTSDVDGDEDDDGDCSDPDAD
jgi:hypothetical protein